MFAAALAVVLGTQTQTITFRSNFETVEKVVERLSAQTQIPMLARGDIRTYPVYLNVKDAPVKETLERLAAVVGAQWVQKDGSWYLSQDQDLRATQEKAGDPEVVRALEATVNAPAPTPEKFDFKELEKMGDGKQSEAQQQKAMEAMGKMFANMFAADEATMKLLRTIGAKDLSTIIEGRRVVLSSNPNQMQGRMQPNVSNAIVANIQSLAKAELEKRAKAGPKKTKPGEEDFDISEMMAGMFGGGGLTSPENANKISLVQASFQIQKRSNLDVSISAYTADGSTVYSKQVSLPIVNPDANRPPVNSGTAVQLSASSKEFIRAMTEYRDLDPFTSMIVNAGSNPMGMISKMFTGQMGGQAAPPKPIPISSALREKLTDPVNHEPFAEALGDVLDAHAAQGKNIIACPSDDVLTSLLSAVKSNSATVEGILDTIDRAPSQVVSTDGTWTIIRASSPLELRSAHCNRNALRSLLVNASKRGYVNLDDCVQFASQQGRARGSEALAMPFVQAVFRTSDMGTASALTGLGFDSLKLYASFDPGQRAALSAGRPIALASLTIAQRDLIARMVFNGPVPPFKAGEGVAEMMDTATGSSDETIEDMSGMAAMGMAMGSAMGAGMLFGADGFSQERTNLLPEGIPVVGSVRMKSFKMSSVMATDTATGQSTISMPELIGMFNSPDENMPPMFKNMRRDYDQYKMATQTSFLFSFDFARKASYFTSLYDVSVEPKTYNQASLPLKMVERLKGFNFGAAPAKEVPPLL